MVTDISIEQTLLHKNKIRCVWNKGVRKKETLRTRILRKKIVVAFILKKVCSLAFFLPLLLRDDGGVVIVGLLILSYQSNCWQAGYDMGRGVMDLCWTGLETCIEQPKSRNLISYIAIWWINSKVLEGSMITSENRIQSNGESSRVIILKSRLNSTGHSYSTSEVRDIFDRQTQVPNDWRQLMCSCVLQLWDRCNSVRP